MKLALKLTAGLFAIVSLSMGQSFKLETQGNISSIGVRGGAYWPFLFQNPIDEAGKQKIADGLKNKNRLGSEYFFDGLFRLSSSNQPWFLHLASHSQLATTFNRETAELILFGNAPYAGQTVALSPIEWISYNYLSIGLQKQVGNIRLGLDLLLPSQYHRWSVNNSSLFTAEDGSYLDLTMDLEYSRSDTNQTDGLSLNGWGAAFNLHGEQGPWEFEADELGIMIFNGNSLIMEKQGTYRYEGGRIDDFQNPENLAFFESADSVIQEFKNFTGQKSHSVLTGALRLKYHWDNYHIQLAYRLNAFYLPQLSLQRHWENSKTTFWVEAGAGGYALAFVGAGMQWNWNSNHFAIFTKHLQALPIPMRTNGVSLGIKFFKDL